jgi:MoxR-like ATPase
MTTTTVENMIYKLKESIAKVVVGKEKETEWVLVALFSGGHVLLEDTPGMGKTTLAKTLAKSLGMDFKRVQCTPDLLPSDILGIRFFNQKTSEFETQMGPIMTNLLLADELNRATPRTQSSLLEAMEERQVSIEGTTYTLPKPFIVIATQNPIESHGTFPLPEAQMDRFLMRISLGSSGREEEREILRRFRADEPLTQVQPTMTADQIEEIKEQVKQVHLSEPIENYLLDLVDAIRKHDAVEIGVSPRAMLALMRSAQALALVRSKSYVTPDEIKELVPVVWGHRIILRLEAELHYGVEDVLKLVLESVPVPVEEISMR